MKKYLTFIVGGGIGTLICLVLTYVLTEFLGWWYILGYLISGMLAIIFNFSYHFFVTFRAKGEIEVRFAKFFVMSVFIGSITPFIIYLLTDKLKIWYIASGIIAIFAMSFFSFTVNKYWVFQERNLFDKNGNEKNFH